MPFPFIIVAGLAAAAGAVGIGKAVSASKDNSRAREINNEANDIIDDAKRKVNAQRDLTQSALEKLGKLKLQVLDNEVKDFLHYFRMIKNARLESSIHEGTLSGSNETLQDLTRLESFAASLATGSAAGLAGGALTAFAAYGATMTLATASTGTAIGALSGVAATNATLAWLGGGTLAAGGFGMAGGAALLGALLQVPRFLYLGSSAAQKPRRIWITPARTEPRQGKSPSSLKPPACSAVPSAAKPRCSRICSRGLYPTSIRSSKALRLSFGKRAMTGMNIPIALREE